MKELNGERTPLEVNIDLHQIRYLARQIETPEQFEAIVASAEPHMRAEVRRLIEPFLTFKTPAPDE